MISCNVSLDSSLTFSLSLFFLHMYIYIHIQMRACFQNKVKSSQLCQIACVQETATNRIFYIIFHVYNISPSRSFGGLTVAFVQ